jgi:hypothetical protein
MIVRRGTDGSTLLVGQTDHSRLVGQFGANWGNESFARPEPFDSVARAAAFHDFGWLRYETAPLFTEATGDTPGFRAIPNDESKLEEYDWCVDWFLNKDPYAAHIVSMHRTGLWRGRYGAMVHPPHPLRQQPAAVDAFVARHEERRTHEIADRGWDAQQMRINYRLLQVWDLLGLYFACDEPYDEHFEPVPRTYAAGEGEGVRMTLTPLGPRTIKFDPFPFAARPAHVQLAYRRMPQSTYADEPSFRRAYFQSQLEIMNFELV